MRHTFHPWGRFCAATCLCLLATCALAQSTLPASPAPSQALATQPASTVPPTTAAGAEENTTNGAATSNQFAFPEEESRKAADAVKRGENPIPVPVVAPPPPPPPTEVAPSTSEPAETSSTPPGKLILPKLPMITTHDVGAEGPDAPKDNGYSSSRDPDDDNADATPANAKDKKAPSSPPDDSDPSRRQLKITDAGSSGAAPTHRIEEDEKVGDFYIDTGNYMGAYLRFKDAVAFAPQDAYAHFGIAESARRLGKVDEAIQNFQLYLKLDPGGEKTRQVTHELNELTKSQPQTK